jgi:demethylmenaquinone methyltransferase / 2-methoxy-6-polyprenyl-1,4-benzoquinol methylase
LCYGPDGMANKFYRAGEQRAPKVRELFSAIARRYDLINDLQSLGLHRRWKRRLARLAACPPGGRALDLCCGTGDVAQKLAGWGARVVGLDFSEPMLRLAQRRRAALEGTSEGAAGAVQFICGDALRLPFADRAFDAVTISYGLRNLARLEEGLREMWRVTKPGGCLAVLDFGKPANPLWRHVYFAYLRVGVPAAGRMLCGNAEAYAYILESLNSFPSPEGVATRLRETGGRNVTVHHLLGGAMGLVRGEKP